MVHLASLDGRRFTTLKRKDVCGTETCAAPVRKPRVDLVLRMALAGSTAREPNRYVGRGAPACGTSSRMDRVRADDAMGRYALGDEAAFAVVYDELAPRLYTYLLRQCRNEATAEDLLQQTMLHMHKARATFVPGASATAWAFAIARRLFIDAYRRERTRGVQEDEPDALASKDADAERLASARELADRLQQELQKLPTTQRTAFELIRQDGLTLIEAAEVVGTTVTALKLRAHRAYEALRAVLADFDPEGGAP